MTKTKSLQSFGAMTLCVFVGLAAVGCKGVDKSRASKRTVKASIQAFDPNADIGFEFGDGGGGGEMPDDYEIRKAMDSSYGDLDSCVADYKSRKGIKAEKQLEGDLAISVKLNPKDSRPLGINASISSHHDRDEQLKTCLKQAVDKAPFPTYDGAPRIVDFSLELDPGSVYEEE
ncbi:MAG: hypothetical protein U0168_26760 [Nannocystaceae bacterium]|jgi:hypothetical protein